MTAWDIAVVGGGPAGAATAIGALRADPSLRVALLDRADFPRDKSCGDGIAPHVIDLLTEAGVDGIVDDWTPVPRLRLSRERLVVDGAMQRPTWVVPRTVFDHRLVEAAQKAGAELVRHRVRSLSGTTLDGEHTAQVVVGADGPHSVVRRRSGSAGADGRGDPWLRPDPGRRRGQQVIVFGGGRQPAYAWSFDRGDGLSNIGYGELLDARPRPTRAHLLEQVEALLPGSTEGATDWVGHQLPLSSWRTPTQRGPVLLAGDAAGLVNPMTGEGIYYAVATGLSAGRAAAAAIAAGDPGSAGDRQRAPPRHCSAATSSTSRSPGGCAAAARCSTPGCARPLPTRTCSTTSSSWAWRTDGSPRGSSAAWPASWWVPARRRRQPTEETSA